ncbi:MAG: hypothetical protein WDM80_03150 [Limisphaerales bacterium]
MKKSAHLILGPKGKALLKVICNEIRAGQIQKGKPETFLTYSGALHLLGDPQDGPTYTEGARLQYHGLTDLNEWSMATPGIPKVTGLIVNIDSRQPSKGYVESNGHTYQNMQWIDWWLNETDKSIDFDWSPYLK